MLWTVKSYYSSPFMMVREPKQRLSMHMRHLIWRLSSHPFIRTDFFDLSAASLADGCEAGDEALAIGHPRGMTFTATAGIISESKRVLDDGVFVQTDVPINPGNSGGPLFDVVGKLIGINTQVMIDAQGLGFAIPAREVLEYWMDFGRTRSAGRVSIPTDKQLSRLGANAESKTGS